MAKVGDIFGIYEAPSPGNDVVALLGGEYPVYGIIWDVEPDDESSLCTEIVTGKGVHITLEWWLKEEEVVLLE